MAVVVTGTATGIALDGNTATPASVNVTVPSDATAAYVFLMAPFTVHLEDQ